MLPRPLAVALAALTLTLAAAPCAPVARADEDIQAGVTPRVMLVIEWLDQEVRNAQLVVLGQVVSGSPPDAATGRARATLSVGKVYQGPPLGKQVQVELTPGFRGGRYIMPTPLVKGQWALLFLKAEKGKWIGPPVGRVIETPFHGLTFFPGYNIVLSDAAPGLSWSYVLDSLTQLIATRRQVMSGYAAQLRAATTQEQRDRLNMAIEMQVKDQLGLPVP